LTGARVKIFGREEQQRAITKIVPHADHSRPQPLREEKVRRRTVFVNAIANPISGCKAQLGKTHLALHLHG
jgi:hypothetical protein